MISHFNQTNYQLDKWDRDLLALRRADPDLAVQVAAFDDAQAQVDLVAVELDKKLQRRARVWDALKQAAAAVSARRDADECVAAGDIECPPDDILDQTLDQGHGRALCVVFQPEYKRANTVVLRYWAWIGQRTILLRSDGRLSGSPKTSPIVVKPETVQAAIATFKARAKAKASAP